MKINKKIKSLNVELSLLFLKVSLLVVAGPAFIIMALAK